MISYIFFCENIASYVKAIFSKTHTYNVFENKCSQLNVDDFIFIRMDTLHSIL